MSDLEVHEGEVVPEPQPLLRARLAVYLTEDRKLVIALRVDGEEETRHMVIPKALVRLASRQYGIDLQQAIAELRPAEET